MWAAARTQMACVSLALPAAGRANLSRTIQRVASIHACSQGQALGLGTCSTQTEFMSWLKNRGEDVECFAVAIGMSEYGRALFAFRPICAGECMLKFSQDLVLTPEKLPQEVIDLLTTDNEFSRVALLLIAEKHKGQESAWAPYIGCLPSFGEIHSTMFWEAKELACLECTPVHRGTIERNNMLSVEFDAVKIAVQSFAHIFGEGVLLNHFKHAYAAVSSRAWGVGPHSNLTMIPFLDFANHNPKVRTIFTYDGDEDSTVVVVADRDYEAGDQVYISYGDHSNATLALDYGFVVLNNPFDQAEIWMEISWEDTLRDRKLQLLVENNMHTLRNSDGSESGGLPFIIEEESGNEEIVSPAARAFARVISSSSYEDLEEIDKEADASDTPLASRPRQDKSKEAQAMNFLVSVIEENIEEHVLAFQALQEEISRPERREIAEGVLGGELRLLRKASAWLKDHCIPKL